MKKYIRKKSEWVLWFLEGVENGVEGVLIYLDTTGWWLGGGVKLAKGFECSKDGFKFGPNMEEKDLTNDSQKDCIENNSSKSPGKTSNKVAPENGTETSIVESFFLLGLDGR